MIQRLTYHWQNCGMRIFFLTNIEVLGKVFVQQTNHVCRHKPEFIGKCDIMYLFHLVGEERESLKFD